MARLSNRHVGDGVPLPNEAPTYLKKAEFGRRLEKLMLSRGWHQSELARRAGLPRDAISSYIRGATLPQSKNLDALARLFNMAPEELLPNVMERATDRGLVAFGFNCPPGSEKGWLRIEQMVRPATARKIMELLEADNAPAD